MDTNEVQSEGSDRKSPLTCPHPGCNRTLSRPDRFRNHLKLHSGEKSYACDFAGCSMAYATERGLNRHKKEKHQNSDLLNGLIIPKLFACTHPNCSVTFAHEQSLVRHVRRVHSKPPKDLQVLQLLGQFQYFIFVVLLQCSQCGAKFKKQNKLKEHMYFHTGEKAFKQVESILLSCMLNLILVPDVISQVVKKHSPDYLTKNCIKKHTKDTHVLIVLSTKAAHPKDSCAGRI